MLDLYRNPLIKGFTTNPTLMHAAGITDYEAFARDILQAIPDRPISLEVFSDDFAEMEMQARRIASWGRERLRQDPRDQHPRRVVHSADPHAGQGRGQAKRHGTDDSGTGPRRVGGSGVRAGRVCLGLCRPHRRYGARPRAPDGRRGADAGDVPPHRVDLGQPPRDSSTFSRPTRSAATSSP